MKITSTHLTDCDAFLVFDLNIFPYIFSGVITVLLTRFAQDHNGRISVLGLFCTDLTVLCLYCQDLSLTFS